MAQLLYLSNRARLDIQIEVSFLCTRARGPDTDYYKKLLKVMKYIQETIGLTLILLINKSGNIKWYVDEVFAVNKYMRRHTGGFMTMVTGGAYMQYIKQKLNTKISIEDKLVGALLCIDSGNMDPILSKRNRDI